MSIRRYVDRLLEPDVGWRPLDPAASLGPKPPEIGKGTPRKEDRQQTYRGLAYAASIPDAVGEVGELFRYPYDLTPGSYGTRQSYLSSAVPTSVLSPTGQHVKQTVARLTRRRDGAYADIRRGILEGGRIRPSVAHPYWVREAIGSSFMDTDEVWITAGDTIWCNNKAVAAYFIDGDLPFGAVAFPFGAFVILLATTGFAGWIPRQHNPFTKGVGMQVSIIQDGANYHPRGQDRSAATLMIPWPGHVIQPAVNQSGTKFAICDGVGWGKAYALSLGISGDPVATEEFAVNDGGDADTGASQSDTTTGLASEPTHDSDTSTWHTGVMNGHWYTGTTAFPVYHSDGPFVTLTNTSVDTQATTETDFASSASVSCTGALYYRNDALESLTITDEVVRTGTLAIQDYQKTVYQDESFASPPVAGAFVMGMFYQPPRNAPGQFPNAEARLRHLGTGLSRTQRRTANWPGGSLVIYEDEMQVTTYDLNRDRTDSSAYVFTDYDDYSPVDSGPITTTAFHHYNDFAATTTTTDRTILLCDPHNGVLAYVEEQVIVESVASSTTTDMFSIHTSKTTTRKNKVVVQFGGQTFQLAAADVTTGPVTGPLVQDYIWWQDEDHVTAGAAGATVPVMQGMCPFIAYRKPNTTSAEMIFAYGKKLANVTPATYLNAGFTEQGIEDWLTEIGAPAAVTTRMATCFRVGGR